MVEDPAHALLRNQMMQQAMLQQRRVMLSGPLDLSAVSEATAQLMYLDSDGEQPVQLVINSPGGRLDDALPLLDVLRLLAAPLTIDVLGRAEGSAGVIVAAAPGIRRLGATAAISLHVQRDSVQPGTAKDLRRLAEAQAKVDASVAGAVAQRTGQPVDWVLDQLDRGAPMRGQDAIARGLVDEIR